MNTSVFLFKLRTSRWFHLTVLGLFFLTAVLFYSPVVINLSSKLVGDTDAWQPLSEQRIIKNTLTELGSTDPVRMFGYLGENIFKFSTYRAIVSFLTGDILAYNLSWFFSFVFAAYGAYVLIRYLTKNNLASVIGGIIYGFAPMHLAYSFGFDGATHTELLPFFVYFFLKFIDTLKLRYLPLAALFFLFLATNELHFTVAVLFLMIIIFGYYIVTKPKLRSNKRFLSVAGFGIVVCFAFLLFQCRSLIRIANSDLNYLDSGLEQTITYSNDIMAFLTPPYFHPLWGGFFAEKITSKFTGNAAEYTLYLSIIVLILSLVAFCQKNRNSQIKLWSAILLVFFILSLGPFLHFLGTVKPKIPLPYLLLYQYVPFLNNLRSVGRIFIVGLLAFSVLASFGWAFLLDKWKIFKKRRVLVTSAVVSLILLEFWAIPTIQSSTVPKIYKEFSQIPGDFSIIEIPIASNYSFASKAKYYNTFHDKKIIGGFDFARRNWERWAYETNTPIISNLLYDLPDGQETTDIIDHNYANIANAILLQNNTRYIIIDKNYVGCDKDCLSYPDYFQLRDFVENNLPVIAASEDKDATVYELYPKQVQGTVYLTIGSNWSATSRVSPDKFQRALQPEAAVQLTNLSSAPKNLQIDLSLKTESGYYKIGVYQESAPISEAEIGPTKTIWSFFLAGVPPGQSELRFSIADLAGHQAAPTKNAAVLTDSIRYRETDNLFAPPPYQAIVQETGDYTVWQFPVETNYQYNSPAAAVGSHPLIRYKDFSKIDPVAEKEFAPFPDDSIPFFRELFFRDPARWPATLWKKSRDIFAADYFPELVSDVFLSLRLKFLIFHKEHLPAEKIELIQQLIEKNGLELERVTDSEDLLVYRTLAAELRPYLTLGDNWGPFTDPRDRKLKRWIKNGATLKLVNPDDQPRSVMVNFTSFTCSKDKKYTIDAYLDAGFVGRTGTERDLTKNTVQIKNMPPGEHELMFYLIDQNGNFPPADERCTRVFNLELVNE